MNINERDMLKEIVIQFITVCEKFAIWDKVNQHYYNAKQWLICKIDQKYFGKVILIENRITKDSVWGMCDREDIKHIYIRPFYSTSIGDVKLSTQLKRFVKEKSIIREIQ